jgi:hypothetical protein
MGTSGGFHMLILICLGCAEIAICIAALSFLFAKGLCKEYWALGTFLAVRLTVRLGLALLSGKADQIGRYTAYRLYFSVYWVGVAVESVLALFVLYSLFRLTLEPLQGLRKVGTLVFLGVCAIGIGLVLLSTLSTAQSGVRYAVAAISQLQRSQSLLTLAMLVFVSLAVRFAGVSRASKIFGVTVGFGIMAIVDLAQSSWLALHPNMETASNIIDGIVICAIVMLWTAYLALPEPERGEIDSRSPLLRWDRRCLAWYGM